MGACENVNCSRGAALSQFNLRVTKVFRLGHGMNVEAIGEGFNLFNAINPAFGAGVPRAARSSPAQLANHAPNTVFTTGRYRGSPNSASGSSDSGSRSNVRPLGPASSAGPSVVPAVLRGFVSGVREAQGQLQTGAVGSELRTTSSWTHGPGIRIPLTYDLWLDPEPVYRSPAFTTEKIPSDPKTRRQFDRAIGLGPFVTPFAPV